MSKFLKKGIRHDTEDTKILQRVFDRQTLMTLYELSKKGKITELSGIISTGKEANVFQGILEKREIAVKIYSIETSDFRVMGKYIRGDPRFRVGKNRREMVYQWAHREFRNLSMVHKRVSCPEPIVVLNNILVMSFIGEAGVPAPRIKDAPPGNPKRYFKTLTKEIREMYRLGLVHGDISEYNILDPEKPVLIDFSMGVVKEHPLADELLERDVGNVVKYFKKLGVDEDCSEVLERIRK